VHLGVILPNFGRRIAGWTERIRGRRQLGPRDPAGERARRPGHRSRGSDAEHVWRVKERHPELRVVPRTSPDRVEAMLEAGCEGVVVTLPGEAAMREFVRRFRD
jgi:hypothetical protein